MASRARLLELESLDHIHLYCEWLTFYGARDEQPEPATFTERTAPEQRGGRGVGSSRNDLPTPLPDGGGVFNF